ncbi:TetR/AcrR family transcriptional regulator [Paenibacillus roseipurpureus]|uniref:TetR/AcrR family transcriptional regulator C-terminal domain-containing protein n=1 Tax=Paenibacillus roseopurpureus TaxID=2918901 RepID=A0AA96RL69_9BACL|nr:TetR/AcrR family transcriptional regulator C-terminal domain-containing protein [Paenibacillus sp. MBLB1832]WNR45455.1 TetR/AcrR family transcriptional regulator C-terminal domain-containing protein [Paenibacillus sp. MBLB1832]
MTTTSRTDPRVIRTRQLIRDAFIELLQEIELEKITVNRIAERATINRVTFYLHYKDIPDMMDKLSEDMITEIQAIISTFPHEYEFKIQIMIRLLEHIASHSDFYKVILASKRIPIFTERLMKLFADAITKRYETHEISPTSINIQKDIAIWYGSSAIIGTIVCWLRNDMPYTPHYLASQLSELLHIPQTDSLSASPK